MSRTSFSLIEGGRGRWVLDETKICVFWKLVDSTWGHINCFLFKIFHSKNLKFLRRLILPSWKKERKEVGFVVLQGIGLATRRMILVAFSAWWLVRQCLRTVSGAFLVILASNWNPGKEKTHFPLRICLFSQPSLTTYFQSLLPPPHPCSLD